MASKPNEFDLVASATSAAELLFQAEGASETLAEFKLRFTQTIAEARRNGVADWGGLRYPQTYGDVCLRSLKVSLWPKDKAGVVRADETIGDDILKPLKKKLERLSACAKTCFVEELALTHLTVNGIKEANICLYTGNVKGAQVTKSEESASKGPQATKTPKHLGYLLAPLVNHPKVIAYLGSVSSELRKVKTVDGTAIHKALIDVALKEKLLQGKDGELRSAK